MAEYRCGYHFVDDANESSWDACTNYVCSEAHTTYHPTTNTEVDATAVFEYEYPDPEYCSVAYLPDRLDENRQSVLTSTLALRTSTLEFRNYTPADWAQAAPNYQYTNPSVITTSLAANARAATTSATARLSTPTVMRVCSDGVVREYFHQRGAGLSGFRGVSSVPLTANPRSTHYYCCIDGYRWLCYVQGCTGSFKCGRDMTRHYKEKHRGELATYSTARLVQRRW